MNWACIIILPSALTVWHLSTLQFKPSWHSDMLHFLQSHIQAVGDALAESISAGLLSDAHSQEKGGRVILKARLQTKMGVTTHLVLMQTNVAIWFICGLNLQTVKFMTGLLSYRNLVACLLYTLALLGFRTWKVHCAHEKLWCWCLIQPAPFSGFQLSLDIFWSQYFQKILCQIHL